MWVNNFWINRLETSWFKAENQTQVRKVLGLFCLLNLLAITKTQNNQCQAEAAPQLVALLVWIHISNLVSWQASLYFFKAFLRRMGCRDFCLCLKLNCYESVCVTTSKHKCGCGAFIITFQPLDWCYGRLCCRGIQTSKLDFTLKIVQRVKIVRNWSWETQDLCLFFYCILRWVIEFWFVEQSCKVKTEHPHANKQHWSKSRP